MTSQLKGLSGLNIVAKFEWTQKTLHPASTLITKLNE